MAESLLKSSPELGGYTCGGGGQAASGRGPGRERPPPPPSCLCAVLPSARTASLPLPCVPLLLCPLPLTLLCGPTSEALAMASLLLAASCPRHAGLLHVRSLWTRPESLCPALIQQTPTGPSQPSSHASSPSLVLIPIPRANHTRLGAQRQGPGSTQRPDCPRGTGWPRGSLSHQL